MKIESIASYLAGLMFILGLVLVKAPGMSDASIRTDHLKPSAEMVRK